MKTNNFLLSWFKGISLGAAIATCLYGIAFAVWESLIFFFSIYLIYAMGVGIATELTFSTRTFMQKLLLYIFGISFSPPFALLFIEMSNFGFDNSAYYSYLSLFPLIATLSCLCYMRAKVVETFVYILGNIAVFIAFMISLLFSISESLSYDYNPKNESFSILIFAILSLSFSTISVALAKKIFTKKQSQK